MEFVYLSQRRKARSFHGVHDRTEENFFQAFWFDDDGRNRENVEADTRATSGLESDEHDQTFLDPHDHIGFLCGRSCPPNYRVDACGKTFDCKHAKWNSLHNLHNEGIFV